MTPSPNELRGLCPVARDLPYARPAWFHVDGDRSLGLDQPPAGAASESAATNAEYKKIKNGQTLAQVRAVVGGQGEQLDSDLYRWKSTQGRYVFVFFDDGRVEGKQRLVVATLSEYNKIKNKNSYDRVKKIIGGPSLYSLQDNDVRYRIWPSPDLRSTIIIAFKHGKVIDKQRVGGGGFSNFAGR